LLWRAAIVELNKEKEQHRIDYHTTRMFPDRSNAPDEKSWLAEMSEGVEILAKKGGNLALAKKEIDEGKQTSSIGSELETFPTTERHFVYTLLSMLGVWSLGMLWVWIRVSYSNL